MKENELKAGVVRHSYHNCKWGYMLCLCSKFDIKPTIKQDGSIRTFIFICLKKEKIDITWHCLPDDCEKWSDYWSSEGVKQTLQII